MLKVLESNTGGEGGTRSLPAIPHQLEHQNTYKIKNDCQGVPKWPTRYGKRVIPRFLGASNNFNQISFWFKNTFYGKSRLLRREKNYNSVKEAPAYCQSFLGGLHEWRGGRQKLLISIFFNALYWFVMFCNVLYFFL